MTRLHYEHFLTEPLLRQLYVQEGLSYQAIATKLGIDRGTVARYLKHLNIPARANRPVKHIANSSGFINLSSDWHAYWLGFLAADGCVRKVKGKKSVNLQVHLRQSDVDHLYNFLRVLQVDASVHHCIVIVLAAWNARGQSFKKWRLTMQHTQESGPISGFKRINRGYALREDLITACKILAARDGRRLYEVMEEALEEYLGRRQQSTTMPREAI